MKNFSNFKLETSLLAQGYARVIGCDEVGRGCLAGPVVAGAVVLDAEHVRNASWYAEVTDSKLLSSAKRSELAKLLRRHSLAWGIGIVSPAVIDKVNIHNASLLAMRRAIAVLDRKDESSPRARVIVDGKFLIPNLPYQQDAIIDGDLKVLSVSAASIIAKVYRDELMIRMHQKFPEYQYDKHKGYGTVIHRIAIQKWGLSISHRRSFCGNIG